MIIKKWNYEKHEYEDYNIPDDWKVKTYSDNMDELVNCPHCGKELKFGAGYTSMEIHTNVGFGYTVCENCYEEEWKRRKESKDE